MSDSQRKRRGLICAYPDLNLIDGSSIWSQTITLALARTGYLKLDFLAKSRPQRKELFVPLKDNDDINMIDGSEKKHGLRLGGSRLNPVEMVHLLKQLDDLNSYDVIVIRGFEIAKLVASDSDILARCWIYLTDIPQKFELLTEDDLVNLRTLAEGSMRILYQSDGFADVWRKASPGSSDKVVEYAPVIPDLKDDLKPVSSRPKKAIYAGKFCKNWKTLEMAESWPTIKNRISDASLVMVGDLIQMDRDDASYRSRMLSALKKINGLTWCGALNREEALNEMAEARVGLSWRSEEMNNTVEISTKILEYGSAGIGAIINRNSLHEKLLGKDYPLFANSYEEYIYKLTLSLEDEKVCQQAADRLHKLAKKYTFSLCVNKLKSWLEIDIMKKTILVAGHDLKFFSLLRKKLEETGRYKFIVDKWQGHNKHDEEKSLSLLKRADIIFCEWCLGNVKWYSEHKFPGQRLVARFHLQEKGLPYLGESDISAIYHISYVSDQIKREALEVVKIPPEKTSVIANLMDEEKFTPLEKMGGSNFTLGMIGIAPQRKRIDLALDTLELLLREDDRYQLRIKGTHPFDYPWLASRPDECKYYMDIMERINSSNKLRYKVIFDPPGNDVEQWLSMVGFILSPSDFESFHLAVGEGMLTRSVPVVWNWPGADEIWGEENIVHNAKDAAEKIIKLGVTQEKEVYRSYVINNYGVDLIVKAWEEVMLGGG